MYYIVCLAMLNFAINVLETGMPFVMMRSTVV